MVFSNICDKFALILMANCLFSSILTGLDCHEINCVSVACGYHRQAIGHIESRDLNITLITKFKILLIHFLN